MTGKILTISVGGGRKALFWAATDISWENLKERLKTPLRGAESHVAYMRMTKAQQDSLKDIGGFVGGTLRNGRRKAQNVTGRDLVTLDLDAIRAGGTDDILASVSALGCASCVYSTRKHEPDKPRLRIVIPLDRTVTAEEYEPIARRLGEWLGIENCDPTTFQSYRLMYWPSASADSEFVYEENGGEFCAADDVLKTYKNWRNVTEWPQVPGQSAQIRDNARKQEDPTQKKGLVGAFCRCYDIRRVMDELIPGAYEPTADPDRYTYTGGSTAGGAIIYEDKWLYSHHATDPASGQLVNAWDLARLHLFGERDEGDVKEGTPGNRLPSYKAMSDMAMELDDVKMRLAQERIGAAQDFGTEAPEGDEWLKRLEIDRSGKCVLSADNLSLIFHNDPNLVGKFGYNTFRYAITAEGALPWNSSMTHTRDWTDADDAALRVYFDQTYGIVGVKRIDDMFSVVAHERPTDDVRDYLDGLEWDGIPRIDTLLIRYLKADDTPYVRAVTRKTLVAAVARTYEPGCKFDNVLTLIGAQGIAKSLSVNILGGEWYNDSIQSFNGKDAQELLRGSWIVEIPEVDRFSTKYDSAIIKQFLTRQDDIFRESYGHRSASHPRRCIFIATTNAAEFLLDATGNRRWWIVTCHATSTDRGEDVRTLRRDRDQVWAEAVALWRMEEPLTLPAELMPAAVDEQVKAQAEDPWIGLVREFLEKDVPKDFAGWALEERQSWWNDGFSQKSVETVQRQSICVPEIWCEMLGRPRSELDAMRARRINNILRATPGWEPAGPRKTAAYGGQRAYRRITKPEKV